jgi:nucleotide-binding universal stress UspA family protein
MQRHPTHSPTALSFVLGQSPPHRLHVQDAGSRQVQVQTHVFLEKESATARDIFDIITRVAEDTGAAVIVAAAHAHQQNLVQQLATGSVTDLLVSSSKVPVLLVKGWPLKRRAASPAPRLRPPAAAVTTDA